MKRGDIPKAFTPEDLIRRMGNLKQEIQAIRTMNNGLTKVNEEIKEFVNLVIGDTESQVITTWFFNGTPTSSNKPEEDWETNEEKQKHLGDLYYDKETGYAYKYVFENNTYSWQKQDNSIANALSIANSSPDSGDNKRIIFTSTPSPPYNTGDIWINDSGEILRCRTSRESGDYSQVDWCTLNEYKDDFYYQNIEAVLNQFIEKVETNYITQTSLETKIGEINANVMSETEKIIKTASGEYDTKLLILENSLKITAEGLQGQINRTGINLLYGTSLYDLSQWGFVPGSDEQYNIAEIIDNEYTKNNFLSGRAMNVNYTTIKSTLLDKNMDYLTLSMKIINNLEMGYFSIALSENINQELNDENINQVGYSLGKNIFVDDFKQLDRLSITFPILSAKDIVTGITSTIEPEISQGYWYDNSNTDFPVLKRKLDNSWKIVDDKIYQDTTTNKYYIPVIMEPYVFYIERNLPNFDMKTIYGIFSTQPILIGYDTYSIVSDTEPTPYKGLYWVNATTDTIKRAKYDGDEFENWELISWTYTQAQANATPIDNVNVPTIPLKGNIMIGDVKLEYGTTATDWILNSNENYGANYKIDYNGIEFKKENEKTIHNEEGINVYKNEQLKSQINSERVFSEKVVCEELDIDGLVTKRLSSKEYIRFIRN